MTAQTPLQFKKVATLIVPVTDQDAALAFYVGVLGFEQAIDFEYAGGERWVEVVAPGGTRLTLARARDGHPAGVETGIIFATADVEADLTALRERGVDTDPQVIRKDDPDFVWGGAVQAGHPPMIRFVDPDGNSFLLVEGD